MHEVEDDVTIEELDKMVPIFRWIFIILGICIIGGIIFAGAKSWSWYLVIPIGACLHFGNQALKRTILNGAEEARKELHVAHVEDAGLSMDEMTFEDFSNLSQDEQRASMAAKEYQKPKAPFRSLPIKTIILVCILMLAVSGFWYGLGKLLGMIFG